MPRSERAKLMDFVFNGAVDGSRMSLQPCYVSTCHMMSLLRLTRSQLVDFYFVSSYSSVKGSEGADWTSADNNSLEGHCAT
jgi:hypothetical protein